MKSFLISFAIVFGALTNSLSQSDGKWSAGVGVTPFAFGFSSALYFNRHLGDRWQLGAMPVFRYWQSDMSGMNSTSVGLSINSRYRFTNWQSVQPYAYGFGGYLKEYVTHGGTNPDQDFNRDYFKGSFGLGAQVPIGSKGWSFDFNGGYFWYYSFDGTQIYHSWFYSFGVFKHLGK